MEILVLLKEQETAIKYIRLKLNKSRSATTSRRFDLLKKYLEIKKTTPE